MRNKTNGSVLRAHTTRLKLIPGIVLMNVGRFFSWTVLAGMAIAGGLFVSDQRVIKSARFKAPPIPSGVPLRLGVVLSDTPGTIGMNQAMTHALLLARDRVNQCGGINQTPVFLAMEPATEVPSSSDEAAIPSSQQSPNITMAIAQEAEAMSRLIQSQDIHGAIAAFTPEPSSHGLISEALDTAIDYNVPTVSPTNTQPLLVGPDNSPFDRFRRELAKVDTRKSDNLEKKTHALPLQTKKTKYWSRTIVSDRQHLMMVAQLAHQQGWNRIATLGPDTDRGEYLEQLLSETLETWSGPSIRPEHSLHYSVTLSSPKSASPEQPALDPSPSSASTPSEPNRQETITVDLNPEPLVTQPPDAIIVFLEPGMFAGLSSDAATSPSSGASSQESTSNQRSDPSPEDKIHLNSLVPKVTLTPASGSAPQAILPEMDAPLPLIATSLIDQLQARLDIEQTPIILGNWLDITLLLAQIEAIEASTPADGHDSLDDGGQSSRNWANDAIAAPNTTSAQNNGLSNRFNNAVDPLSHPLTGLRGILSRPALSPYRVLPKLQKDGNSSVPLLFKSAIVHSTWDAAVLMMLAAEEAGYNHKDAIQDNLRNVANPPGIEVTDVCEALELIRQGQAINYQGISGRVDLNGWGDVNPPQMYKVWEITPTGAQRTIETLEWLEPSSSSFP